MGHVRHLGEPTQTVAYSTDCLVAIVKSIVRSDFGPGLDHAALIQKGSSSSAFSDVVLRDLSTTHKLQQCLCLDSDTLVYTDVGRRKRTLRDSISPCHM